MAAEFVGLKADVIVTLGTPATVAAKKATVDSHRLPHRVRSGRQGFVACLARPGGNVTGLSIEQTELAGKKLKLLRERVPGLRRLAMMANGRSPAAVLEMGEVQAAAPKLGIEVTSFEDFRGADDIAPAFEQVKGRTQALYIGGDSLVINNQNPNYQGALVARLPTMFPPREYVEAGGLMSSGPIFPDLYRRAAE